MKKLLLASLLILATLSALASPTSEKGLEIARERDRRDLGWQDSVADLIMLLRNKHGQESKRHLRIKTLEVTGDGDKSIVVFDQPRDIKGTALMTFSHPTTADEQWLYLPALKRVKRISSKNKSGPFMGSEFAYEDLSSFEVDKYTYNYLRDEVYAGHECFVVESDPVDKNSGYTRLLTWVDKAQYRVQKIEFYDRKNSQFKTLALSDYRQYQDKYWRAHDLFMQNHQNGKSTRLSWSNYSFGHGLTEQAFNKNSLKRAK